MFVDEKAVGEQQEVKRRITKMSEAIREGCKLAPRQIAGIYTDGAGGACAVGAAMLALGFSGDVVDYQAVRDAMCLPTGFHAQITRRNDYERWTREQIADWLEGQGY